MRKNKSAGFTLIELMVTVAVIAIIARLAYPAYTSHFTRAKRSAAQSFMVTVSNREEQSMLNSRSYFSIATGVPSEWSAVNMTVPSEVSGNYTITVNANNASTPPSYTITAAPQGKQATNDASCGNLTYTNTGSKGITGTGTVANCWR
jgi:type IV pilus assembly protein PilE